MTPLPRNIAGAPVGYGVGRDAKNLGNRPVPAEQVNQMRVHASLSQIVKGNASANYHSLCVERIDDWAHFPGMDGEDKNGGPNHLRAWRTFRGLTQSALAERIGTNPNMIQYLETGERGLSAKWLRKLAPALETTPGLLLDHDPHELDADILEIWGSATERERRQISEVAKALVATGTDG